MDHVKFTKDENSIRIIRKIVKRAVKLSPKLDKLSLTMDISATHANGTPLKLAELYNADDFNFAHDVFGIMRHIDRNTGKLTDCFLPRFHA